MKSKSISLLEKAQAVPTAKASPRMACSRADRIALTLAYIKGEVSQMQICKTIWPDRLPLRMTTSFYCFIIHGFRDAFQDGLITINKP